MYSDPFNFLEFISINDKVHAHGLVVQAVMKINIE